MVKPGRNLKTFSERSQSQKDEYCMLPFMRGSSVDRLVETESRIEVARARGEGAGSYCLLGTVSVWEDEKLWRRMW